MSLKLQAKVCGLTCAEDAELALKAGADLLGFVVHPPSPRHCADVRSASAPDPSRGVLVMVADSVEMVLHEADRAGLRRVQPHLPSGQRKAGVARLRSEGLEVLLPWADEPGQEPLDCSHFLWEPSPSQTGVAGGSGQSHAMGFPPPGPFFLAGGLSPDNLLSRLGAIPSRAKNFLRGVDAASRLERSPGRKDPEKVRAFLATLNVWNASHDH